MDINMLERNKIKPEYIAPLKKLDELWVTGLSLPKHFTTGLVPFFFQGLIFNIYIISLNILRALISIGTNDFKLIWFILRIYKTHYQREALFQSNRLFSNWTKLLILSNNLIIFAYFIRTSSVGVECRLIFFSSLQNMVRIRWLKAQIEANYNMVY